MAANPFDEFDSSPSSNPFDEFTPQQKAENWGKNQTQVPEGTSNFLSDFLTKPTEAPEEGALGRIGTSTLVGAGYGLAIGAPTGAGMIPAAIGGATTGLVSGIAGEMARQQGAPESVILASEIGGGAGINILKNAAEKGIMLVAPTTSRNIAKLFSTPQVEANVGGKVKDILFGKPSMAEGFTLKNTNDTQYTLRKQFLGETDDTLNTTAPGTNVSDILRGKLYDDLGALRQQTSVIKSREPATYTAMGLEATPAKTTVTKIPNTFANSPEYKKLMGDIGVLKEQGGKLEGTNISEMITILTSENSANPEVIKGAGQRILNLIQNGSTWTVAKKGVEAETKTIINEDVRDALKKRFDDYLQRNLGEKSYSQLKAAESAEFLAQARDTIPLLLNSEFKGTKTLLDKTLDSIKNNPEARKEFAAATFQHLRRFDDSKSILAEFAKNRDKLSKTGVMTDQQLDRITTQIKQFDTLKDKGLRFAKIRNAIAFPLIGVVASEGAGTQKSRPFGL